MDVAAGPWGGPNNMEVVLVRMHPHKAGEEFQARRRLKIAPYEARAVTTSGSESGRACSESARSSEMQDVSGATGFAMLS